MERNCFSPNFRLHYKTLLSQIFSGWTWLFMPLILECLVYAPAWNILEPQAIFILAFSLFLFFFFFSLQLRVHCAEALGTPIVGDYKYGWFVHSKWKQMPRVDYEPTAGEPYRLRRPEGLDVQKGSVLSKVPLLHLHCREMILPNIEKFIELHKQKSGRNYNVNPELYTEPDILRFVAPMPSHMKISWNLMSSYLI